jgi:GT2 family glycosyltransferase
MRADEPSPDVSILIVSWNTRGLTEACLETLPGSVPSGVTFETIVVDNGSTDGSLEMLRARAGVELVANGENRGYAAAVNQAYARSAGGLVLLLNSDIEFKPGSLGALVAFLEEHAEAAGVGPIYLNPDGSPQQHHYRLPTFGMLMAASSSVLRRLPGLSSLEGRYRMLGEDFSRPRRVEQPSASVLLLRRDVLPPDYLLDERFPIYFNDVELAYRLREAGHELWVTPDSEVFHVHGASTRQLGPSLRRQHLAALVRYVELTEPARNLVAFRLLMFVQKTTLRLLRRPGALPLRDLVPTLRGNPGPLPQAPRP